MTRGDLVTVAAAGDYGRSWPALVIQADAFAELPSVAVLPLTSDLREAPLLRIAVEPTAENGLSRPSQVMVDKPLTVKRERIGGRIGRLDPVTLARVGRALSVFLGLG